MTFPICRSTQAIYMQLVTSLILEEFSPGFRNLMALLEHTGEVISEKATTFTAVSGVPAFQRNFKLMHPLLQGLSVFVKG